MLPSVHRCIGDVVSEARKLNMKFYLISGNLNSHMWQVASVRGVQHFHGIYLL